MNDENGHFSKEVTTKYLIHGAVLFCIGLAAGAIPFLAVYAISKIIEVKDELQLSPISIPYILLLGVLVGIIALIFNIKNKEIDPKDVFMNSLSIPVLLMMIVLNITDKAKSSSEIENIKENSSKTVVNNIDKLPQDKIPLEGEKLIEGKIIDPLKEKESEKNDKKGGTYLLFLNSAYAQSRFNIVKIINNQVNQTIQYDYMIVLDVVDTEEEAIKKYELFSKHRFKTEDYYPKEITIIRANDGRFYITYKNILRDMRSAYKIQKLLEINDFQFIKAHRIRVLIVKAIIRTN